MTRIPWVTAQAEGIRHELHQVYAENPAGAQLHISISNEEGLLDALLEVNQELVDVIRGYEDLERMGISERRETEQPTEVMLGRSVSCLIAQSCVTVDMAWLPSELNGLKRKHPSM